MRTNVMIEIVIWKEFGPYARRWRPGYVFVSANKKQELTWLMMLRFRGSTDDVYVGDVRLDHKDGSVCDAPDKWYDELSDDTRERVHDAMVGHAVAAGWRFR